MAILGNWVFCNNPKKLHPDLSDKELDAVDNKFREVVIKSFKENQTMKKFGWHNDAEELKNRWQQATGKNIELHQATMSDVKVFESYMKEWTKSIENGYETSWHAWKLLPQKLKIIPGGEITYRKLIDTVSYERRHKINAQLKLKDIQVALKKLAGKKYFDVDTSKLA
jgi:hypothetical protein